MDAPVQDRPIPWTRLQGSALFDRAMSQQDRGGKRRYHCSAHVVTLYDLADTYLKLPYDRALDLAILTHDVIFDAQPDRELRSVAWLEEALPDGAQDPDFKEAAAHILRTVEHRLDGDPRMALLDLADLARPDWRETQSALLRREAMDLHGVSENIFALSFGSYLEGLLHRFRPGRETLPLDLAHRHEEICNGIAAVRNALFVEDHTHEEAPGA